MFALLFVTLAVEGFPKDWIQYETARRLERNEFIAPAYIGHMQPLAVASRVQLVRLEPVAYRPTSQRLAAYRQQGADQQQGGDQQQSLYQDGYEQNRAYQDGAYRIYKGEVTHQQALPYDQRVTKLQPIARRPRTIHHLGNIVSNRILGGYESVDETTPQIDIRRAGRHTGSTNATEKEGNYTTIEESELTQDLNFTGSSSQISEDRADSPSTLQQIMNELKRALSMIMTSNTKPRVKPQEKITENSTTTQLVTHISESVDSIVKSKNNETKIARIKDVSFALDILLNRIARSAKDLMYKTGHTNVTLTNKELMERIVKHMREAKRESLLEKLRGSGIEMTSQEVDASADSLILKLRQVRQQDSANNIDGDVDAEDVKPEVTTRTFEVTPARQETEESSSEEGGGNLVANLLSSFLGSLSTPTGGVDVDAIVGLISGLSVQKDDGSYDFSGLTDLLQSFFGGDGEGGGGSDVGAFLGGLVGAIIQGSANPPGPKGTGKFTGDVIANLLPGLLGPPPSSDEDGMAAAGAHGGLDSGSFLAGLLSSMLGASSGTSSGSGKPMMPANGNGNGNCCCCGGSGGFFMKIDIFDLYNSPNILSRRIFQWQQ